MLFHQMQLMVCAVIAKRWSADPDESAHGNLPSGRTPADAEVTTGGTSQASPIPA